MRKIATIFQAEALAIELRIEYKKQTINFLLRQSSDYKGDFHAQNKFADIWDCQTKFKTLSSKNIYIISGFLSWTNRN